MQISGIIVVLMGVSGSGKTTVGKLLAAGLGWRFYDADDFHLQSNVNKMRQGIALTDADRDPWLAALRHLIQTLIHEGQSAVVACSALKQAYRDRLRVDAERVRFVYLKGDPRLIRRRLEARQDHFAKADLLASQFDALEEPEGVLVVDAAQPAGVIVDLIKRELGLSQEANHDDRGSARRTRRL